MQVFDTWHRTSTEKQAQHFSWTARIVFIPVAKEQYAQTWILITRRADWCHLSKQWKIMCLHYITRQKAQMMHLAFHYLEKFHLRRHSFQQVFRTSLCVFRKIFNIYEASVLQSGLKTILIIDIHQPSYLNRKGETMPLREIHHC